MFAAVCGLVYINKYRFCPESYVIAPGLFVGVFPFTDQLPLDVGFPLQNKKFVLFPPVTTMFPLDDVVRLFQYLVEVSLYTTFQEDPLLL